MNVHQIKEFLILLLQGKVLALIWGLFFKFYFSPEKETLKSHSDMSNYIEENMQSNINEKDMDAPPPISKMPPILENDNIDIDIKKVPEGITLPPKKRLCKSLFNKFQ